MKTTCPPCFRNVSAFLILIFALTANIFAQPQYYNYSNGTSYNSFPFNQAAGKMVQTYIAPAEFTTPSPAPNGNITKFHVRISTGYPLGPVTYANFKIIFIDTNITSSDMGVFLYTSPTADTVLSSVSYGPITAAADTWLTFNLDHPHAYNNTRGLLVQIEQTSASGTFAGNFSLQHTTTATYRRTFSAAGAPFTYGGRSLYVVNCGVDIAPPVINCTYSWSTNVSGVTALLQAVSAPTSSICWVAGATAIVRRTTDGGTTWTNANPNPGVITGDVYNIWALDANTALLTTSPAATYIYRTTNGGTNWTQVFTQAGGFIDAIVMTSATNGYAYGDPVSARWSLWKTTNGGINWDSTGMYLPQVAAEAGWNNAMCVVGSNIWFGTNLTKVYHSTNGGATGSWTAGVTTGNLNTYGVWFTSATNGICVGTIVQKTTDGGTTWIAGGPVAGTGNMTSIGGNGNNYWLTRGNNIYGSSDFGATWTTGGYTGTTALWGTSITTGASCLAGWSVGATGTVVRLNGVPVSVNDPGVNIPAAFKLEQNYPNPFNPTTNITFAIPTAGNVELRVYDVLGREVMTLMNSYTNAGTHMVPFDASSLSSGVYVYKIISGSFVDSKKMVLIK